MKLHLITGILLLIVVSFLVVTGFITQPETKVTEAVIIEAPQPVIWNILTNLDGYQRWCDQASFAFISRDSLKGTYKRKARYLLNGSDMEIIEEIRVNPGEQTISIMPAHRYPTSYLENFHNLISMDMLPDGSTQVRWRVMYTVRPFVARTLNRFGIKPAVSSFLSKSLQNLKATIE